MTNKTLRDDMTSHEMLDKIEATVRKHIDMCGYDFPEEYKLGEEALAIIPQLRASLPQWKPIETQDDPSTRSFLVFDSENLCQYVVYFRDNILRHFESDRIFRGKPTHFMPLPPAPEGKWYG